MAIIITVMFVLHFAIGQHVYSTGNISSFPGSTVFRLDEFLFLGGRWNDCVDDLLELLGNRRVMNSFLSFLPKNSFCLFFFVMQVFTFVFFFLVFMSIRD